MMKPLGENPVYIRSKYFHVCIVDDEPPWWKSCVRRWFCFVHENLALGGTPSLEYHTVYIRSKYFYVYIVDGENLTSIDPNARISHYIGKVKILFFYVCIVDDKPPWWKSYLHRWFCFVHVVCFSMVVLCRRSICVVE